MSKRLTKQGVPDLSGVGKPHKPRILSMPPKQPDPLDVNHIECLRCGRIVG